MLLNITILPPAGDLTSPKAMLANYVLSRSLTTRRRDLLHVAGFDQEIASSTISTGVPRSHGARPNHGVDDEDEGASLG